MISYIISYIISKFGFFGTAEDSSVEKPGSYDIKYDATQKDVSDMTSYRLQD